MKIAIRILQGAAVTLASVTSASAQWQQIPSGASDSLTAITWVDGRFLIAGGNPTFLRSFDNGLSFTATNGFATGINPAAMNHLAFHDNLVGYATNTWGCCALQRTTDGGSTWEGMPQSGSAVTVMRLPLNEEDQVVFRSGAGVQFDAEGLLLYETEATIYANLDSVCPIPNAGVCWVDGTGSDAIHTTGSHGWILTSNDRGTTVQGGTFPYSYYVYSAHVIHGDTVAYVDFERYLLMSHDKGSSWAKRGLVPFEIGLITPALRMWSAAKGAACDGTGLIHLTEDSGATWFPVPTPGNTPLYDLLFLDATNVLAVGDQGTILASSDGGYNWEPEQSGTTARLHGIARSPDAVIVIGNDGIILRRDLSVHVRPAVADPSKAEGLELFPNPACDQVQVSRTGPVPAGPSAFSVIDARGRRLSMPIERTGERSWVMDIAQLPAGSYTLELSNEGGMLRRTLLVVR
jgi:photosystem II stability/assembly factor-like uncharacterized protein